MDDIEIYTDGGCSGNPGPGGWAFVLSGPEGESSGSGGEAATTNNRMELRAVIEALKSARALGRGPSGHTAPRRGVVLYTDSQYVKRGITEWIAAWKRNGWRTSDKKPVKNRELWEELDGIAAELGPRFLWVEGHAGIERNERCDAMVQAEIRKLR